MPPSPPPRRTRAAVGAAIVMAITAACGSSGRAMDPPAAGVTAPPRATSSTASVSTTAALFTLTSPNFEPGGRLPADAACPDGVSPALNWSDVPPGTVELVLVMSEYDGDQNVRWLVTGIPPASGGIPAGALPPGAVARPNSAGEPGYDAPCPTSGSHTYDFQLLALGVTSSLPADLPAAEAVSRLEALAGTKRAGLTATYTPPAGGTAGTGAGDTRGPGTTEVGEGIGGVGDTGPSGTGG